MLADVGIVGYQAADDPELVSHASTPLTAVEPEPLMEVGPRFKYLLHLDGATYSNRLQLLLLTGSLVLKQQSRYHEYYYAALDPWTHFVPFYERSPDDILSVLPRLPANDSALHAVALRGQAFARAHLNVGARMCYWKALLTYWAHLLAYRPTLAERPSASPQLPRAGCHVCHGKRNRELIGPHGSGVSAGEPGTVRGTERFNIQ